MSVLAIDVGASGITAAVVTAGGDAAATGSRPVQRHRPGPGRVELAPEDVWRATLGAVGDVLAQVDAAALTALEVATPHGTLVLWDRETLGSPRRAITAEDGRGAEVGARLGDAGHADRVAEITGLALETSYPGTALAWIAEHEPHTWALVEADRYAVGTLDSYLVARMTRGLEHVTDVANAARTLLLDRASGTWSDEMCTLLGVPRDALPDLVPGRGTIATTDPRSFLGLALPITALS